MKIIHWFLGLMIIGNIIGGYIMPELTPPFKFSIYQLHKSLGMTILVLVFLRIVIRLQSRIPNMPDNIKKYDVTLSRIGVLLLYICMIAMPCSGYLMSSYGGYPVTWFGIAVPSIVGINAQLSNIFYNAHQVTGYVFAVLIAGHILYVIKHLIYDKTNLLKRIM